MTAPRPLPEDRIRAALWFAGRGFGVFPVWSTDGGGTCRCPKGIACDNAGKHPITAHGFQDATGDAGRIQTFLSAGSDPNYGLTCPEGVFALDVDGDGLAQLAELETRLGPLPPTLRTRTAHGKHIFLRWPETLPRPIGQAWGFVTRWGSGQNAGYVVGPRSVHASGTVYEPEGEVFDIAELPEAWAEDALAPSASAEPFIEITAGRYELPDFGYPGSRYEAILRFVGSRYMRGITRDEIYAGVLAVLSPRFAQPLTEPELRSRFERAWRGTPERLGEQTGPRVPERPDPVTGGGIDGADLLRLTLPPLRMVVPDLLPEGTTILAAPPKVGKSCLVYQLVVEVSIGGDLLGRRVAPGSCLYLALEDGQRRGQDRLRTALAGRTLPHGRLEIQWSSRRIGKGLEDDLATWLDAHQDAAVVAIDTLQKVRAHADSRRNAYEVDVEDLGRLQNIFRDRAVALVIVHHLRKESGDDFLTSVSGTYGLTGSADSTIVIRRKRLEAYGKIVVTGRDIAESEISVAFADMLWTEAPAVLTDASAQRGEVYGVVKEKGPIWPVAIARELDLERTNVQHMVTRLADTGAISRTPKGYVANQISLNTPPHSSHSESDDSEAGYTRVPAREAASTWLRPCSDYKAHQQFHRQTGEGWVCDACHPEEKS